ncbi:hypothetical protein VTH06DRAFT_4024 [Thermothelomyces fergusii]
MAQSTDQYPAANSNNNPHRRLSHEVEQRSVSNYDATAADGSAGDDMSADAPDMTLFRSNHHHHPPHPLERRHAGNHEPSSASSSPGAEAKPADEATGGGGGSSPPLDPRPSTSADDPLNWPSAKKHAVLASLIPGCLLSDWTLTWGTAVFAMQAAECPGIALQGLGGLAAVPLCERYGRLPVLFYSQLFSLAATVGAALAPSYGAFTAFRALQGLAGAPPQVLGLCVVHDLFFAADRARKVNLWAASFLVGPYLGPLFSALLVLRLGWRDDFAVLAGLYALSLLVVAALGDETLFVRAGLPARVSAADPVDDDDGTSAGRRGGRWWWWWSSPSRASRHLRLLLWGVGVWREEGGVERVGGGGEGGKEADGARAASSSSLRRVWWDQCALLARPYLLLPTALFITPITMWTIGMVTTVSQFVLPPVSAGGYGFSTVALSMLHIAPILGTLLAEAWGHWFNDFLAATHMARFGPECRLTATYLAVLVGAVGLVLFGQTLEHHLSWVGLAFGWAMLCFGTLANMTAVSAYLLDCLPSQASMTAAWLNFARVVGGFSVAYFQLPWVHRNGPALSFGLQAVVMVGATFAVLATQIWGRGWRAQFPAPQHN